MNELLAIIIIVFLCCAMFFAWLISMATCPDRMVDLISGSTSQPESSSSSSPTTSKELISGSNSPHGKRSDAGEERAEKPKKKYSTTFLQLGVSFKQRAGRRNSDNSSSGKPNPKKLSVVPEQDEQLTVYSKSSQPRYSISLGCAQEPLIEHSTERSTSPPQYEPKMLQLVPFVAPTVISRPVERCVEDVIDARRRQQQLQQQQYYYHDNSNDEADHFEEDTIFLLPPRYELLHAALAEADEARAADADAISLPNSPRGSSTGASITVAETRLCAPLYYHNQYCHSETRVYIPPSETIQAEIYAGDPRRHSFSYII